LQQIVINYSNKFVKALSCIYPEILGQCHLQEYLNFEKQLVLFQWRSIIY